MNRQQKEAVVKNINEQLKESNASFLIDYKGLSVAQLEDLRGDLRQVDGSFKVTKARLMKIAAQNIEGIDSFKEDFKDQVGLVFVKGEVPSVAKKLVEFSKENEQLDIVSGFFESKTISKEQISYLASIPSREVLLAQLAGTIQAPISTFARLLNQMIVRLVYVLDQVSKKG
ncbi:50S ribosomal protein L10 [Candidatus Dependentiae bacterium]|nr:50S ribosomal protein L10 [Candidatus Dependentiae bacterium]